jgi:hypothetical protein
MGRRKPSKKQAKYRNKKVEWGGMKFDSIREFERYQELALLEKVDVITDLQCQVRIKLTAGDNPVRSKKGRQYAYVVDFKYFDREKGRWRYEDVKGYDTPLGNLKMALVEAESGIEIEIVR